jgi:hypothetical protein
MPGLISPETRQPGHQAIKAARMTNPTSPAMKTVRRSGVRKNDLALSYFAAGERHAFLALSLAFVCHGGRTAGP